MVVLIHKSFSYQIQFTVLPAITVLPKPKKCIAAITVLPNLQSFSLVRVMKIIKVNHFYANEG